MVRSVELSLAIFAFEKLDAQVSALMVLLVTFSDEPLVTELALEGLVPSVSSGVQNHEAFVLECLVTVWVRALDESLIALLAPIVLNLELEIFFELLKLLAGLDAIVLMLVT